MPDYDLGRFSTRGFEQLVQALSVRVLGPGVVVFGDGPDGAREATFEGKLDGFPAPGDSFEGYVVVQAKCRERPQGTGDDGKWALAQLRGELETLASPGRKLRCPDGYVFATNVVLSPASKRGAKDRAAALVESYRDRLPIRKLWLWDADQIRAFLDADEGVRRSYAAWITPGDVLAAVFDRMQAPSLAKVIPAFLAKELLADRSPRLSQGQDRDRRTPLSRVFVDLTVSDNPTPSAPEEDAALETGFLQELIAAGDSRYDQGSLGAAGARAVAEHRRSLLSGRYVLVGGPGQGKSTLGQYLCQLYRTAALLPRAVAPEVEDVLRSIESETAAEGVSLPGARRFPVRIELSAFAEELARGASLSVMSYIAARMTHKCHISVSAEDLLRWLGEHPWLVVFDGLDEVPASSNRGEVLEAIEDFMVDVADRDSDVLVLATTRPQGYGEELSLHRYHHRWLTPLSRARAVHYARRLLHVRFEGDPDQQARIIGRMEQACSEEATSRLMSSPLQVTIMATLVEQVGQPPRERWRLFRDYYETITRRELEKGLSTSTILRDHRADVDAIHRAVGLRLQVESERAGGTDACLGTEALRAIVHQRLAGEGHEGAGLQRLQRAIIEAASERLVLLVGVEADRVGFEVRSLQELMAAEALMDGTDEDVRRRLRAIAPVPFWRNTFLFAAGKCYAERQYLRDTIHSICAELNENDGLVARVCAGSELALDLVEDGTALRQPNQARALTRLALRLLRLPPDDRHERLVTAFRPELRPVYEEELREQLGKGTVCERLGAWALLIGLVSVGEEWARELGDRFWPKDGESELVLLAALPHRRFPSDWARARAWDALPRTPFLVAGWSVQQRAAEALVDLDSWRAFLTLERALGPSEEVAVPVSWEWNRGGIDLRIALVAPNIDSPVFAWADRSDVHWTWCAVTAGADFVRVATGEALAAALQRVASVWSDHGVKPLSGWCPWPLAACVQASATPGELFDLAHRARGGDFGTERDWRAAELRWRTEGISHDDVIDASHQRVPGLYLRCGAGHPLPSGSGGWSGTGHDVEPSQQLAEVCALAGEGAIMKWFVGLHSWGSLRRVLAASVQGAPMIRRLFDMTQEAALAGILAERLGDVRGDEAGTVDAMLQSAENLDDPETPFGLYRELLRNQPQSFGVFRALAAAAPQHVEIPPQLLVLSRFQDERDIAAAVIVRVFRGVEDAADADDLLAGVRRLSVDRRKILVERLSEAAAGGRLRKGAFTESFIVALLDDLPAEWWIPRTDLIETLRSYLRERQSPLCDAATCKDLALTFGEP